MDLGRLTVSRHAMRRFRHVPLLIAAIAVVIAAGSCASASRSAKGAPLPGEYRVVDRYRPAIDGKPELLEVFSFQCEPCYRLMKTLPALERRYDVRVRVRRLAVHASGEAPFAAKLFYIAEKAGKEKAVEVMQAIYRARFAENRDIEDAEVLAAIAKENGIADEYAAWVFSAEMNDKVEDAMEEIKGYGIAVTPSVVLNRSLLVSPAIAGGTVEEMQGSIADMLRGLIGW